MKMNFLWTDIRYAWHEARRSFGITIAIIAMLALGTGGATAVFNPIYSTLLAPLPFPQQEQLVIIGGAIPIYNGFFNRFEKEEELSRIFSSLTTYAPFPATSVTIPDTGKNKEVYVVDVNKDFFKTLGVRPLRGSDFNNSEITQAFVVSYHFWRNELTGEEDIIGKWIQTPNRRGIIIGIMPESFDFPVGTDIWMHDGINGTLISTARQFLGRLRSEIPMSTAAKELRTLEFKPGPGLRGNDGPLLQSLKRVLLGNRTPMLLILGSTAILFLILICAGVMNLLITRGVYRKSEMAIRLTMGATRRNLVFQLLRETLPLVVAGSLVGLWLSEIASAWLMAQFPMLNGNEVVIPVKMVFFATLVFAVTIIGGLTPALCVSNVDLNSYLKSGSDSKWHFFSLSLRELLVSVQLSLALALLTGVSLLVSSMMFHSDIPIRWSSRDMAIVRSEFKADIRISGSPEAITNQVLFFQELQHNLITMPEVITVGIFRPIPFSSDAVRSSHNPTGVFNTQSDDPKRMSVRVIEGYANPEGFEILGITLISGRHFSPTDMANETNFRIESRKALLTSGRAFIGRAGGVVIVNQSFAQKLWPSKTAIGEIIYDGLSNSYEVIGVVRNFYQIDDNKDFIPAIYYPPDIWRPIKQTFLVKLHSEALIKDFRQRLSGIDTSATIETMPLEEVVSKAMANASMMLQLLGIFAVLGVIVSGLGVYATMSLMAATWIREIGIHMAFGAQILDILRLVLWRGIRAIFFGLSFGLLLAWILSRMLDSYLFLVKINNPLVWVISCAFLLVVTIIAALIPALRVIRVNPMDALRN